ncbi:hypothetical protein THAOC_30571, partial [Thalassiosira oceanica]
MLCGSFRRQAKAKPVVSAIRRPVPISGQGGVLSEWGTQHSHPLADQVLNESRRRGCGEQSNVEEGLNGDAGCLQTAAATSSSRAAGHDT